jgi:hypothetical protein
MKIFSERGSTAELIETALEMVGGGRRRTDRTRKTMKAVAVAAAGFAGLTAASARVSTLRRAGREVTTRE